MVGHFVILRLSVRDVSWLAKHFLMNLYGGCFSRPDILFMIRLNYFYNFNQKFSNLVQKRKYFAWFQVATLFSENSFYPEIYKIIQLCLSEEICLILCSIKAALNKSCAQKVHTYS